MAQMHACADTVAKPEAQLPKAALDGRPKAKLMSIASRIMSERTQIIATKADRYDNPRRIFTEEQYQQMPALYRK